jgi:hypothetical protein
MTPIDTLAYSKVISAEISRHLEDSEISKLSHFFVAARYERIHKFYIGLPTTIAALLLSWLVAQKDLPDDNHLIIFTIKITLGLVVAVSTGISTFLNYNELASQHRKAALKYQDIWRKCKNWHTDFPDDTDLVNAKKIAQAYRSLMTSINQESPQIPRWAWKSVDKQRKEGSTRYDNE